MCSLCPPGGFVSPVGLPTLALCHQALVLLPVQVAAFCMMLDKDLRDRKKTSEADISDLLTASYSSMLAAEASRRLKAVPTAFYSVPPKTLFGAGAAPDFPGWKF